MKRIGESDLQYVLNHTQHIWDEVRGKSIFITGATGFFGKWLLETFLYVNNKLDLNASVCALSRNPDKFLHDFPFYKDESSIKFIKGDIQDFEFPEESFQYIIHAATDADAQLNIENPLLMLDTITIGIQRILNFAKEQKGLESFLLTSSGAVYGKQPHNVTHINETDSFFIDINQPSSAYAEGKRLAELYCAIYHKQFELPTKIARCFAFVGPYLPLDKYFAIGNFISDSLNKKDIIVKGDGTPYRSYLYAADLAIWLWVILLKGKSSYAYNVGSDEDISIADLAKKVVELSSGNIQVDVQQKSNKDTKPLRYVPLVNRGKTELALTVGIDLAKGIRKTIEFYSDTNL